MNFWGTESGNLVVYSLVFLVIFYEDFSFSVDMLFCVQLVKCNLLLIFTRVYSRM